MRPKNKTYFIWMKKNQTWACDHLKTSNLSADNFQKILDLDGLTPEPAIRSSDTGQRIPCFDSCQLIKTLINGCVHYQFFCALKLARSMRLNIDRDLVKQLVSGQLPNNSRHLDELTHEPPIWQCDTGQWLSCFDSCQFTISWMANVKDVDLLRHAWDTPPFLLIVSPTLPVQSVDAYVRTYARSVTWQPKEKRLTIFHEYGALSHARFAREGAPL